MIKKIKNRKHWHENFSKKYSLGDFRFEAQKYAGYRWLFLQKKGEFGWDDIGEVKWNYVIIFKSDDDFKKAKNFLEKSKIKWTVRFE
jgi:hypothetical protein